MLAAMSTAPLPSSSQATAVPRDRGDACPGTLRLHAADDGALARIRLPGGVLTVPQASVLLAAARERGDGALYLTSRGNVQLRGLPDGCGAELAAELNAAGLLPSYGHERVRNIVASPLSGLDGRGFWDVRNWPAALDAELCGSAAARELSGRFLFALDDGRGDVAALGADLTVRAGAGGGAQLGAGASDEALSVSAAAAPRAALLAAEVFLELAREGGAPVWRVAELPVPPDELTRAIRERLAARGIAAEPVARDRATTGPPPPGAVGSALVVHAPLGRLTADQWLALTETAAGAGDGELRLTPWRGAVVPVRGLGPRDAADALRGLAGTGLVTGPESPWLRVGACIGSPGCAKSRSDVRADAARALSAAGRSPLPLYWSGCERRCGRPPGDRIDAVAAPDGGYHLTTTGPRQAPRTAFLEDPSRLAAALAAIAP
ncbi:cobalamin biosynthesis protein CobG [Streptomyces sp. NPDC058953]|uniref:cobalamin biosynthesis protein CobG n=1 Tax=Streptomyces sp. NPDC058953 TaxID=3346676 RepID=UPI0036ADFB7B